MSTLDSKQRKQTKRLSLQLYLLWQTKWRQALELSHAWMEDATGHPKLGADWGSFYHPDEDLHKALSMFDKNPPMLLG